MKNLILCLLTFIVLQGTAYDLTQVRRVIKEQWNNYKVEHRSWWDFRTPDYTIIKTYYNIRLDVPGFDHEIIYETEKERDKDFDRVVKEKNK